MNFLLKLFILINIIFQVQTIASGQDILKNTSITIGGFAHEISTIEGILGPGYNYTSVSPEVGINYKLGSLPFSFSYRKSINYSTFANPQIRFNLQAFEDTSDFEEFDELLGYFHFQKQSLHLRMGIGFFHKRWITPGYFVRGGIFEHKGAMVSFSFDFKNTSVEFKKYIEVYPRFALLESYLYGISVYKNLQLIREEDNDNSTWDNFYPVLSLRMQAIKYHKDQPDLFNWVGFVPGIGLGYHFRKQDISVEVNREFWKKYTGGTLHNDLIGFISTSGITIKKHFTLKSEKQVSLGVGWHPIQNRNEPDRVGFWQFENSPSGQPRALPYPRYVNIYGMSVNFTYRLNDNHGLEFRQIFPYFGDYFFNPYYTSIGFSYNWR